MVFIKINQINLGNFMRTQLKNSNLTDALIASCTFDSSDLSNINYAK